MGAINGLSIGANLSLAARAHILTRIKEEELYKALCGSWEQFCAEHLPISRATADNLVRELKCLGEDFMVAAGHLGLGQRDLRALAAAPTEVLPRAEGEEIVIGDQRVPLTEKARVLDLIENLLADQAKLKLEVTEGFTNLKKKQDRITELKGKIRKHEAEVAVRLATPCDHDFLDLQVALDRACRWLSDETPPDERPHPAKVLAYYRAMAGRLSEISHYGGQYVTPEWATDPDAMARHLQDVLERGEEAVDADPAPEEGEWGDEDQLL